MAMTLGRECGTVGRDRDPNIGSLYSMKRCSRHGMQLMKKLHLVFVGSLVALSVDAFCEGDAVSLFNGEDLGGWHADVPKMDDDPSVKSPFIVRDGMLVSLGTPGGHLITDESYANYRLEVEYRFAGEPGNCGVLVHASTPRSLYGMFPKSIEVQMYHQNAGDFLVHLTRHQRPRHGKAPRAKRRVGRRRGQETPHSEPDRWFPKTRSASGIAW